MEQNERPMEQKGLWNNNEKPEIERERNMTGYSIERPLYGMESQKCVLFNDTYCTGGINKHQFHRVTVVCAHVYKTEVEWKPNGLTTVSVFCSVPFHSVCYIRPDKVVKGSLHEWFCEPSSISHVHYAIVLTTCARYNPLFIK